MSDQEQPPNELLKNLDLLLNMDLIEAEEDWETLAQEQDPTSGELENE